MNVGSTKCTHGSDDCYGTRYGRVLYERTMIAISVRYTITYEVGKNAIR